jgi:MoxR-like ATPase
MFVRDKSQEIINEITKVIIGQGEFITNVVNAFLSGGHVLIEGVPGLGKTLTAKVFAKVINCDFKRIQFTPDLMPSDITGTKVFNLKKSEFYLQKGPVFTNILLADEINRTPPKTQSALLEAMEEKHVTIDGETLPLDEPFFVLATQNPIEYEGTYPLPEAQLDRFMMKLHIGYFSQDYENELLKKYNEDFESSHNIIDSITPVCSFEDIKKCRKEILNVKVEDGVVNYITSIVNATRRSPSIMLGGSPRASIALLLASKTAAAMLGRDFVTPDEVKEMALPVLRHRIILRPEAGIDGLNADAVINAILNKVEVPR